MKINITSHPIALFEIAGESLAPPPLETNYMEDLGMKVIEKNSVREWTKQPDGSLFLLKNKNIQKSLNAGCYNFFFNNNNGSVCLAEDTSSTKEDIMQFPDSKTDFIVKEIKRFWKSKKQYTMLKKPYKRSFILYGKPGVGKTCTISLLIKEMIKENGIVLKMQNGNAATHLTTILSDIKEVEPHRKIMVIIEDIDAVLENSQTGVSTLLNALDGVSKLEDVVFIATTNYIERLESRVSNRPSRFDRVIEILPPSLETRKMYLKHLTDNLALPSDKANIDKMARDTDGLSYAHLTELVTAMFIFDDDCDESIKTLKGMKKHKNNAEASLGFAAEKA